MILVVVGDTEPGLVQEMIRQRFSELTAGSDLVACPDFGRVAETGTDVLYLYEPDLGYTNVTIESVWNTEPRPDTLDNEVKQLQEYVGAKMLDNRLQHLVNMEGSPMTRSDVYSGRLVQRLGNTSLDARTSAEDWQQTLVLLDTTLRQALTHGFSEPELDRVKKELSTMLKKQVQVADSRDSRKLADGLIHSLNKNEVFMSPVQELALYGPILEKTTLVEANEAFHGLWHERRLVEVTGTADLRDRNPSPEAVILQDFQDSKKVAVSPWVQQQEGSFPYLLISGPVATVDKHIEYSEIGVDRYLFSSGF
jgi:zinc protease